METINDANRVPYSMHIRLLPNYHANTEGAYIAKPENEEPLTVEEVCKAMKDRGYSGNYQDLVSNVKQFFDESAYQLCNGKAVNTGYYSIHPGISGTFNSVNEAHNHKKNPVNFKFRIRKPLKSLARGIIVSIVSVVDSHAYIDEFIDTDEKSVNDLYSPGDLFCISGNKIMIAGDHPDCGIFFVPVEDPSKEVRVKRIAENNPSRLVGIAPATRFLQNKIIIRTQYTGSKAVLLRVPHAIESSFVLEAA
ncbi:MAG: DUF4469 domain-containing protein [Treponema sp.]|jgi:hypothetical protein|nr:DUF4469 domain-containing protein [Treponema sp.]